MATPLRKDQPEFENEENITTADLAKGKRPEPAGETRGPQAVANERTADGSSRGDGTPLFPNNELNDLRTRWKEIQTAFVDEPRKAVEQADGLVASAMKRLAEVFAQERSRLEQQWDRGDNVSTEDLRVALQRYRSFFDRLLSV
ncbi:MAG TPA: hypothetical protein VGS05_13825 [Candidatus Sulfotelmatobacter sp.]|nr:hypothetical protein [Candidatus Sulfotelmatobacter sp.]